MIFRVLFFALMALGVTGFGIVAWVVVRPPVSTVELRAAAAAEKPLEKKRVLVAARALHAGSLLKPEDLTTKEITTDLSNDEITVEATDTGRGLVGALVRRSLGQHELLRAADLVKPGDHGFLAAALEPGKRGITIGVDATTGSAGLIWPGDKVDVILTQTIADPSLPPGRRVAADILLQNARVIAIDQHLVQGSAPTTGAPQQNHTVTLEVLPGQAERVSVAMRLGRLSLSLRSAIISTAADEAQDRTTWAVDVSSALGSEAPAAVAPVVRIFRGSGDAKEFKF